MTFQIRAARPHEYATVGEITVQAYAEDGMLYPGSDYADVLRDAAGRAEKAELWVAVDPDQNVLGSVTFCPDGSPYRELARDGEGEFRMLGVDPSARGRGVARALVERCIARSRELGDRRIVICSDRQMGTAHRLYGRLGFVRAPELDWSPLPGIDLLGFSLDLEP
ncbi:MAG: GNAT family N-acetyltransferase [Actinomycetota bacterium]|nr:GNAT family N-acetyltransferase [Actinomycetota bacterium]